MEKTLGTNQTALLDWLVGHWLDQGPAIAFIEGFGGTGKSEVARGLIDRAPGLGWRAVRVIAPESEATAAADLALDLAQSLSEHGDDALVRALDEGQDLWDALAANLATHQNLLVIDEAQLMMRDEAGTLPAEIARFVQRVASRNGRGRVLFVADRAFRDSLLPSRHSVRHLDPFTDAEALGFLEQRLREEQIPDAVPETRRRDVIRALGNNLNAIEILSVALRYDDSLDELIGLEPELWSLADRAFDQTLLKRLERKLIARIISRLEPDSLRVLNRYCVHRKPVKAKAFKRVSNGIPDLIARRDVLVRSFLVDHDRGWDTPNRLVREIVLAGLGEGERRGCHSLAADHYTRHFVARKIEDSAGLGGHFVEARYHLSRAGRGDDLAPIAAVFQDHLRATLTSTTSVPADPDERDERIALLLGLYRDKQGPSGIEYHLARCLAQRDQGDDWRDALRHARRACSHRAPADAWVLYFRLEAHKSETASLWSTIQRGMDEVSIEAGLEKLYVSGAELLADVGERERAIDLLREGIGRIPADKSRSSLYQTAGMILSRSGRYGDAIEMLQEGMGRIPSGKWGRERVIEPALYYCLALGDKGRLDTLLAASGAQVLGEQQRVLAEAFRHQMERRWREAAEKAAAGRVRFPTYLHLTLQESFAWLCASEPGQALAALDSYPGGLRREARNSIAWLEAFAALQAGDETRARAALAAYLGEDESQAHRPSPALLLRLWDQDADLHGPVPAYNYPTLPPSLTGLPMPVTRLLHGGPVLDRLQAGSPDAMLTQGPPKLLAVATEWWSRNGGLSTFNRDACKALAAQGARVSCLVPRSEDAEKADALAAGVTLIDAQPQPGMDPMHWLLQRPRLGAGRQPDWIIGHVRITGAAAKFLHENFHPEVCRAQFIHTAPGQIEWHKEQDGDRNATEESEDRERLQLNLARGANLVVAVGPRLSREFGDLLAGLPDRPPLHRLDPGLTPRTDRGGSAVVQCLLLGRAQDAKLKGLDLAARALARLAERRTPPRLVIRGSKPGTGDALRQELLDTAGRRDLDIRPKAYTADIDRLQEDLRRASMLLMPSRSEGFGLVATEAIAAGVPILVSEHSGVAELLRELLGNEADPFVVPIRNDLELDAGVWAERMNFILLDQAAADRRAADLYEKLSSTLTWTAAAQGLLDAIR